MPDPASSQCFDGVSTDGAQSNDGYRRRLKPLKTFRANHLGYPGKLFPVILRVSARQRK